MNPEMIEMIVQAVMRELEKKNSCSNDAASDMAVIVGNGPAPDIEATKYCRSVHLSDLPESLCPGSCSCVVISELSFTELADIALGRQACRVSSFVLNALLAGVKVYMPDRALPQRRCTVKCSPGLYALYEEYAQRLRKFGIISDAVAASCCEKTVKAESCRLKKKVLTESDALALVKSGESIVIDSGCIVTPAARDIFNHCGMTVTYEGKRG